MKLGTCIRPILRRERELAYHRQHRRQAESILKAVESEKGKTNPRLITLSREYALDVFGSSVYEPWLRVYSAVAGEFREGWIPDNYYGHIVVPVMKGLYGKISDAKALSPRLFDCTLFPDIAYYCNGLFYTPQMSILPQDGVKEYIFRGNDKVVFKSDNSLQGLDVNFFTQDNFDMRTTTSGVCGVFQRYIDQHSFFDEFSPNSVATIRITAVVDNDGDVACRAAYLRIGEAPILTLNRQPR
jgi:hypothetical protein